MTIEKKIRLLTITVLVLIATNVATIATIFFQPFPFKNEDRSMVHKEMRQRFKEAGFTKDQMSKLKQIRMQYREESKTARENAKEIRHNLHQQLLADSPDTTEINRLINEMSVNYLHMKKLAAEQFLKVKPHCTRDQLHMLLQGDEQMNKDMGQGRHGHNGCPNQDKEIQDKK